MRWYDRGMDDSGDKKNSGPRHGLLVASLMLIGFALLSLPSQLYILRHPRAHHGFEVDIAWYWIWVAIFLLATGCWMVWKSLASGRQFNIKTILIVTFVAAIFCWIITRF
jgi:hypothetical protein